ncbi:MAG: potassium transporter Kup [Polyangiaceae bacterium]|nr:potassium transporter Kup [Polyangiaceae bacterium]
MADRAGANEKRSDGVADSTGAKGVVGGGAHPPTARRSEAGHAHGAGLLPLSLGALGVVYGDIGTSPLYAMKECFHGAHSIPISETNVYGVLSLMFWALLVVISGKYLSFVLRADNEGEGGMLALLALVPLKARKVTAGTPPLVLLVLFGTSLLYGDGIITPAISVLSAVEGLNVATDAFQQHVVPLTVAILLMLFALQRRGTAGVAVIFGPVMVTWFLALGVLGVMGIVRHPSVLASMNPLYALRFLIGSGYHGFLVLGSVLLCISGGEALYADMGHFGRKPIRLAWFAVVLPCLLLHYWGQGAAVLTDPEAAKSPLFWLVPRAALYPMVALATMAAVVASQAMISGAFSLTRQAIQLGFFPRVTIVHTSHTQEGQIYVPEVNTGMGVLCLLLVLTFRSSDRLAAAYGIAVIGAMTITSFVYYVVVTRAWHWDRWKALLLVAVFLLFDLSFLGANVIKIADGGWVPLLIASGIFALMTTWKAGRKRLADQLVARAMPLDAFLAEVEQRKTHRVGGTAIFMSANPGGVPPVLLHHFRHNQVLHEQVVLLSILSERVPFVSPRARIRVDDAGQNFFRVSARFGFMETPNVPALLEACAIFGLAIDPDTATFYLGRETLLASKAMGMAHWRKALFAFVSRNARSATAYFGIPPDRVVEIGMQVEL